MKLIEKMAEDYTNNDDRKIIHKEFWDKASGNTKEWIEIPLKEAFEAGFRAAREMALAVWHTKEGACKPFLNENTEETQSHTSGHMYCDFFYDGKAMLERLGEEDEGRRMIDKCFSCEGRGKVLRLSPEHGFQPGEILPYKYIDCPKCLGSGALDYRIVEAKPTESNPPSETL